MTPGEGGGGGDDGWELPAPPAPEPAAADVALRAAVGGETPSVVVEPSGAQAVTGTIDVPTAPLPPPHATTARDRDDDAAPPRPRRSPVLWVVAIVAAVGIGAVVFLGRINAGRYAIACEPDEIVAQDGRGFPPWGMRARSGVEWKPIAIPPNAECRPRETDDAEELAGWYRDALVERATAELAGVHDGADPARVEVAAAELDQALLLARAPERRDQRNDIARLQGDVEYGRAVAKLAAAEATLVDAAKQFDAAAAKRPRHVADASAWSAFVRKVADQLRGGPNGALAAALAGTPSPASPGSAAVDDRVPAPPGVALPVEPAAGSSADPAASPAPASTAVDAGVPGGGVLL